MKPRAFVNFSYWLLTLLTQLAFHSNTIAEDNFNADSVTTRLFPEFEPLGIVSGSTVIYPRFGYSGILDDNVFATNTGTRSAYISVYSPEVASQTLLRDQVFNLSATADLGRNHEFASEDYNDWKVSVDTQMKVRRNIRFSAGGNIGRDHVARLAPDATRGLEPTKYYNASLFGKYTYRAVRYAFDLDADIERRDYDDVPGIVADTPVIINNDDRDRTEYDLALRSSHTYIHEQNYFLQISGNQRDYDELQDIINADRSSKGLEVLAGLDINLDSILVGDISIGYLVQNYMDPFPDIKTPAINSTFDLNVSPLTTIRLDINRTIKESINIFFSGYISTAAALVINHEFRRNILLNTLLLYVSDDYVGIGTAVRDDETYDIMLGSTYRINRKINISMQYHHLQRDSITNISTVGFNDFKKNLLLIQLQAQI